MTKNVWAIGLVVAVAAGLSASAWAEEKNATAPAAAKEAKQIAFDGADALAAWTVTGDVAIDKAKGREGKGAALKVGPKGKALLKLRDTDGSGKVDLWVYDDHTVPADAKVSRVGPRWGLVETDGKILAVGILYAAYLGGNEGYTASACDGQKWFDQLFWLGVNRAPAGWHHWTFDFDPEEGLRVFHDGKELAAVDSGKTGLKGFSGLAIWGDEGQAPEQTIWVADVAVTLGGPAHVVPRTEGDPYDAKAVAAEVAARPRAVIYTKEAPPATPKLEDLPLKDSICEFGITWTFDKPSRVGQFVNGDWYVVGPATVRTIDPKPLYGAEIPRRELDSMDKERPEAQRVRNGFMLNPPAAMKVAYDSGVRNWFDPSLIRKLPVEMKPGDSLVSTISMPKGLVLNAPLRNKIERGVEDCSPIRTAAVLTCVAAPQPPDAFRPAFCDRQARIYLSRNLRRDLLPAVAPTPSVPKTPDLFVRFTQRPWVGTCFFGFEEPVENMPQYGMEYGRVAGTCALLLCTDFKPADKEPLLVNYVQVGIDLGGIIRAGHPGWSGWGGHGSGRKLPITVAGLMLGDDELAHINKSFPKASFGEDEQTAYGDGWTGAKVVFAGHSGIDAATGVGRNHGRGNPWGPYEHMQPSEWKDGQNTSEGYRRTCTSGAWVAEALALRLLKAENAWGHDAFFDYVDRWMFEDDDAFVKKLKEATRQDYDHDWSRCGWAWQEKEAFVKDMWTKYRTTLSAPTDGWKQKHDDAYYRAAIEKSREEAGAKP